LIVRLATRSGNFEVKGIHLPIYHQWGIMITTRLSLMASTMPEFSPHLRHGIPFTSKFPERVASLTINIRDARHMPY
jgi:hypothetical protein